MKPFEETKNEITEFMNNPRFASLFESQTKFLKDKIFDIFTDIEALMKDDDKHEKLCSVDQLSAILDSMMFRSIEFSISEYETDQLRNITALVYNYNDNTYKDESVKVRSMFLTNFLDGFLSLRDCINIVRNLSKSCQRFADFNPPSFELSKHYIDSIYGPCEEKDEIKDCGE